jgi:hypothetical protein
MKYTNLLTLILFLAVSGCVTLEPIPLKSEFLNSHTDYPERIVVKWTGGHGFKGTRFEFLVFDDGTIQEKSERRFGYKQNFSINKTRIPLKEVKELLSFIENIGFFDLPYKVESTGPQRTDRGSGGLAVNINGRQKSVDTASLHQVKSYREVLDKIRQRLREIKQQLSEKVE